MRGWLSNLPSDWGASLLGSVALLPGLAAVATVTAAALLGDPRRTAEVTTVDPVPRVIAVLMGFGSGILAWGLFSLLTRRYARADRANIRMFSELRQRLAAAEEALAVAREGAAAGAGSELACREADRHLTSLRAVLGSETQPAASGPVWTLGAGYIAAWQRLHRAEEALLEVLPRDDVAAMAFYDAQRLEGSKIADRSRMLRVAYAAVRALSPGLGGHLPSKPGEPPLQTQEARAVVRQSRRIINEYRDDAAAGLVTLRRRLTQSVVFTGLTAYLVLALAIVMAVPLSAIVAGAVFYLVGALIGLLARLRSEARLRREKEIDDYGVTSARMVHLALLSGMAGIAGVVLVGLLSGASLSEVLDPSGTGGTPTVQSLGRIFDLGTYPIGLVIAAIFGLTPELLLSRLSEQGESMRSALTSSEASGSEATANPANAGDDE